MPYKYKYISPRPKETLINKSPYRTGDNEVLTGNVQGLRASDIEERWSRSLTKLDIDFQFRARITSPNVGQRKLTKQMLSLPGEVEIDTLIFGMVVTPVLIQGEIAHFKTKWQAEIDREKQYWITEFGKNYGWAPLEVIEFYKLKTQAMSDQLAREMFT